MMSNPTPIVPNCIAFPGDLVELISLDRLVSGQCSKEIRSERYKIKPKAIGIVIKEYSIKDPVFIKGFKVIFADRIAFVTNEEIKVIQHGRETPDSEERKHLLEAYISELQEINKREKVSKSLMNKLKHIKNLPSISTDKIQFKLTDLQIDFLAEALSQVNFPKKEK